MRVLVTALLLGGAPVALQGQAVDWSANGRDTQGTRYSPASDITRQNITRLAVAWTYRTGETDPRFKTKKETAFEATPQRGAEVHRPVHHEGRRLEGSLPLGLETGGGL